MYTYYMLSLLVGFLADVVPIKSILKNELNTFYFIFFKFFGGTLLLLGGVISLPAGHTVSGE